MEKTKDEVNGKGGERGGGIGGGGRGKQSKRKSVWIWQLKEEQNAGRR